MQTLLGFSRQIFSNRTHNPVIQLFRYGIVGGLSFLVDFGLLALFTEVFGIPYLLSACLSFVGGLTANYFLSIRWVFDSEDGDAVTKGTEFALYAVIGLIGLGLNVVIMWFFTELVFVHYLLSKIISTIIVFMWNFMARRVMITRISRIWKKKTTPSPQS